MAGGHCRSVQDYFLAKTHASDFWSSNLVQVTISPPVVRTACYPTSFKAVDMNPYFSNRKHPTYRRGLNIELQFLRRLKVSMV